MSKITKIIYYSLIIVVFGSSVFGASIKKLSLNKAIEFAMKNNPTLKYFEEMLKSKIYQRRAVNKSRNGYFQFESGVTGTTEPGNSAFLKVKEGVFDQNYQMNEMNDPTSTVWSVYGIIKYLRPLSTGGMQNAIERQKALDVRILNYKKNHAQSEIIFNIIKTYINISMVKSEIKIVDESIQLANKNTEMVKSLVKKGLVVKSDLLNANIRVLNYRQQKQNLNNKMKVLKKSLMYLMGFPFKKLDFELENLLCMNAVGETIESLTKTAFLNRADIKMIKGEINKIEYQIQQAKSDLRLKSNFIASYEINNSKDFKYDGNGYLAGIQFVKKFGDSGSVKNKVKAYLEAKKALKAQLRGLVDKIKFEITQAFYDVQNSINLFPLLDKSIESSKKSLEIITDRYNNGMVKFIEVMDAELRLNQAKQKRAQTIYQHCMKLAELKYYTGQLKKGFRK